MGADLDQTHGRITRRIAAVSGKGSDSGETDSGTERTESQTQVSPDSEDALIEAGGVDLPAYLNNEPIDVKILSDEPDGNNSFREWLDHRSISMRSVTSTGT